MAEPQKTSRPPLSRMLGIHAQLQEERYPNCAQLGRDFEVSSKTIQRDLDFMRDECGLPIKYHALRRGYFYTIVVTAFPALEVSEGEVVALFAAQNALPPFAGTNYEKSLQTAFQKITGSLADKISFDWDVSHSEAIFPSVGQSVSELELFEEVSKAVLRSNELHFNYRKRKSDESGEKRVQPYHLGSVEGIWTLLAFDPDREQFRLFALSRMKKVRRTKQKFRRAEHFSVPDYFAIVPDDSSKETQKVILEFDAQAGHSVSMREWHDSQIIERLDDGVRLSFDLPDPEQMERWILGWGAHVRVIEPASLIEKIVATVKGLREIYFC